MAVSVFSLIASSFLGRSVENSLGRPRRSNRYFRQRSPGGLSENSARERRIAPPGTAGLRSGPDQFYNPEWPGPSEEPVGAGEQAAARKSEDEARAAPLQRIHEHHESDCGRAEQGEHPVSLTRGAISAARFGRCAALDEKQRF